LSKALDPTQIANLLKADDANQQARRASRIKSGKFPTEPRNYETWFALPTHFRECTNPECKDPRDNKLGKAMVAEVNGKEICRYCFLEGANREANV
jgi:hypothetical protein